MSYELIKIQGKHHDQVTEIILNPPPANIISVKMMDEISDCLKIQQKITDKKLIIFSGEGQHFSYGACVEEHLPEVVGDAGIYFDPTNEESISQGVKHIIDYEHLRQELRRRGLERAKLFRWERTAEQIWQILVEIIEGD